MTEEETTQVIRAEGEQEQVVTPPDPVVCGVCGTEVIPPYDPKTGKPLDPDPNWRPAGWRFNEEKDNCAQCAAKYRTRMAGERGHLPQRGIDR